MIPGGDGTLGGLMITPPSPGLMDALESPYSPWRPQDLGVPLDVVRTGLDALKLGDFDLNVTQRSHSGIVAPYFSVVESKVSDAVN